MVILLDQVIELLNVFPQALLKLRNREICSTVKLNAATRISVNPNGRVWIDFSHSFQDSILHVSSVIAQVLQTSCQFGHASSFPLASCSSAHNDIRHDPVRKTS
jgi:exosome complex RNA-binding protein Rrp4